MMNLESQERETKVDAIRLVELLTPSQRRRCAADILHPAVRGAANVVGDQPQADLAMLSYAD